MSQVNLTFPDSTYTSSSKPACDTLKVDLAAIETAYNAHDSATTAVHGITGTIVGTSETQTLLNKTLTSPVFNTGVSGAAVLDEDAMGSDSATKIATQQSIKAYVDNLLTGENSFKVRATPADEDIDADGTEVDWTDWDLQSVVGATATAVLLRVLVNDDTVGSYMAFRENGEGDSTSGLEAELLKVQVVGQNIVQDIMVKCDASQKIEYKVNDITATAITSARATVIGWWQPIM